MSLARRIPVYDDGAIAGSDYVAEDRRSAGRGTCRADETEGYRRRLIKWAAVVHLDKVGMGQREIAIATGYHVESVRKILNVAREARRERLAHVD